MSNPQATVPSLVYQASAEDLNWGFDTSNLGGAPTVVSIVLTTANGATVALSDNAAVFTNVISQRIRSGVLSPASPANLANNGLYYLTVVFTTATGGTNKYSAQLQIKCPY